VLDGERASGGERAARELPIPVDDAVAAAAA
jgi:hypothetical protein